jgi:hypothetical protein
MDVYGHPARISRYDYALGRTQIHLYCQTTATLLAELPISHEARRAQGGAVTLHRDNIARVLGRLPTKQPGGTSSGDLDFHHPGPEAGDAFASCPETHGRITPAATEPLQLALFAVS